MSDQLQVPSEAGVSRWNPLSGRIVPVNLGNGIVRGLICLGLEVSIVSTNCTHLVEKFWYTPPNDSSEPHFGCVARISLTGQPTRFTRPLHMDVAVAELEYDCDVLRGRDLVRDLVTALDIAFERADDAPIAH
ncbi:MAG: hypothetical protein QOJ54_450, partial [Aliidongia sp.]|nr:hypothetical protein [Aliidongia sp.]